MCPQLSLTRERSSKRHGAPDGGPRDIDAGEVTLLLSKVLNAVCLAESSIRVQEQSEIKSTIQHQNVP